MKKLFYIVTALTLLLFSSSGYATIYWEESFDGYSSINDLDGYTNDWDIWTQNPSGQESSWISLETSSCQSSKCLKLTYPSDASAPVGYPGATYTGTEDWGGEFFVRFYAKVTDKQAARGKFYKMFGSSGGSGDSNWTFSANTYTAGRLNEFAHGGTNSSGDTQCYARFNNGTVGCSSGDAGTVQNYYGANWNWDDENWHKFIIHFKFNTNSSSDGIFRLWIDGDEWFYVTGVQQRPNGNDRFFKHFNLGDYTSATNTGAWSYWYDEFVVASTYLEADTGSGGDSTPPVMSNTLPSGAQRCDATEWPQTTLTLQVTTDENATCKYDVVDQSYDLMTYTFSTTGATAHSQDIEFNCGDSLDYYFRCADGSDNKNTSSEHVSFALDKDPPAARHYHVQ